MYKSKLGYMHELTALVFLLIQNNKGINPGELLNKTESNTNDLFKVLTVLLTAGGIKRFQNGFIINPNPEELIEA